MQENCLEDFLRMLAGMSSGEEQDDADDHENSTDMLGAFPGIRQACIMVLQGRRGKIRELEQRITILEAKRDEEIKAHDRMVDEIKRMDTMFAHVDVSSPAVGPVDAGSSEGPVPPEVPLVENPAPPPSTVPQTPVLAEKVDVDEPTVAKRRGRKAKFSPEFKRLSMHRPTGNPRLDALETALHDALEQLNNSRMAYHFMAIKEVRLALTDLYKTWDKPDAERIAELEAGLKAAVEVLSTSPIAANSKTMRQLWGDLILVLKPESQPKQ